jgi:general stress protein YciG
MLRRYTEPRGYETMNPERPREMADHATQNQNGYDRRYQDDYEEERDDYDDEYEEDRSASYRSGFEENDWDENDRPSSNYRQQQQDWDEGNRPSSYYRGREEDWHESNRPSSNYRQQEQGWDEDEHYENVSNEFVDDEDVDEGNYNQRSRRRGAFYSTPERGRRGFASMSRDEVSRIGRKGGLASHRNDRTNRNDQRSSDTRERRQKGSSSRSNDSSSSSTKKTSSGSSRRGFAAMSPEKVSRIARKGGLASHKNQQSKSSNGRNATTRRSTSRNR